MWLMFHDRGFFDNWLCQFLAYSAMNAQVRYFPHVSLSIGTAMAVACCAYLCLALLCRGIGKLIRRELNLGRESGTGFVDIYGPHAPLDERYGRFGAAGRTVGFVCAIVINFSPLVVLLFYFLRVFEV
ncbi:hypothetical protein EI94DRAFT_1752802, partial [Lactarius quietus]